MEYIKSLKFLKNFNLLKKDIESYCALCMKNTDVLHIYNCIYCSNCLKICNSCNENTDYTTLRDCFEKYSDVFKYIFITNYGDVVSKRNIRHPNHFKNDINESIYSYIDFHILSNVGITTLEFWQPDNNHKYICKHCIDISNIILHPSDFKFKKYFSVNFDYPNENLYNYSLR